MDTILHFTTKKNVDVVNPVAVDQMIIMPSLVSVSLWKVTENSPFIKTLFVLDLYTEEAKQVIFV